MDLLISILVAIIVLLLSGYVVSWAWNNSVVTMFDRKPITVIQGTALFVLVFMLLGFWRV